MSHLMIILMIFADYLCQWSKELAAPVFSVDYSLAPEAPYPRAVMEVSSVYHEA